LPALTELRVHSTIPASDMARARAWYADKLGFEPILDLPSGMMFEAAEGTRFVVFPSPNAGQAPQTCMGFATSDIEREVRDLKASGVTFEEYDLPNFKTVDSIVTAGPARSAWFRDSEGNILGIVQLPGE
jgi:catechol 2,3-dioxygenase-like lactoylglutathione lyase family enzyme